MAFKAVMSSCESEVCPQTGDAPTRKTHKRANPAIRRMMELLSVLASVSEKEALVADLAGGLVHLIAHTSAGVTVRGACFHGS